MSAPDTTSRPPCDAAWSPAQFRDFIAGQKAILVRLEASGDTRFSTRLQAESCRAAIAHYGRMVEEMEGEEKEANMSKPDTKPTDFNPLLAPCIGQRCTVCGHVYAYEDFALRRPVFVPGENGTGVESIGIACKACFEAQGPRRR